MTTQHTESGVSDHARSLHQTARIRELFSSMPYGGSLQFRYPKRGDEWTLDDLEHNIRCLRDRLVSVAERDSENQTQLLQHKRLFAALGEFAQIIGEAVPSDG